MINIKNVSKLCIMENQDSLELESPYVNNFKKMSKENILFMDLDVCFYVLYVHVCSVLVFFSIMS